MTLNCLVVLSTEGGPCSVAVRVNSLHQLAVVMPAPVISYEVVNIGESGLPPIADAELFDYLVAVTADAAQK